MTYWQYLIKVGRKKKKIEDRKKIEKYFKSSCLRELKTYHHLFVTLINDMNNHLAGYIRIGKSGFDSKAWKSLDPRTFLEMSQIPICLA